MSKEEMKVWDTLDELIGAIKSFWGRQFFLEHGRTEESGGKKLIRDDLARVNKLHKDLFGMAMYADPFYFETRWAVQYRVCNPQEIKAIREWVDDYLYELYVFQLEKQGDIDEQNRKKSDQVDPVELLWEVNRYHRNKWGKSLYISNNWFARWADGYEDEAIKAIKKYHARVKKEQHNSNPEAIEGS